MHNSTKKPSIRWLYLFIGVLAMIFAGIIYAWSILKFPFTSEFNWSNTHLANNFTITMCAFCLGGLLGARISKCLGYKLSIIISAILVIAGFIFTSTLSGKSVFMLFLTYGVLSGGGIGIAYNVIIGTISMWFPDKKGLCSGCLMMGFGASALILGNLADLMFKNSNIGWRMTYIILGCSLGIVLVISALILKKPNVDMPLPNKTSNNQNEITDNYSPKEMLKTPTFWLTFLYLICLTAVGSSVISFAKDLALEVNTTESLAVSLVGVLSICNGLGRILTGASFDIFGKKQTMVIANIITIVASIIILLSLILISIPLCIIGLCLTGISYGACPTIASAFTLSYYGNKYFPTNMAIMTFNIMGGSLIASLSSSIRAATNGFVIPFIVLLGLTLIAGILNIFIKKPKKCLLNNI